MSPWVVLGALVAVVAVALGFAGGRKTVKPPVEKPVAPPGTSTAKINAPQTFRGLLDQEYAEDVLLDFAPILGEKAGCPGTYESMGITGVAFDKVTHRFGDGVRVNVAIQMEAWNEPPHSAPARNDTVFVWDPSARAMVPLGEGYTQEAHFRTFPGWGERVAPGGYQMAPKGDCPTPPVYVPPVIGGTRHAGKLIVTVDDHGVVTRREFPWGVWIAQCSTGSRMMPDR
jgi:hypothetical protein